MRWDEHMVRVFHGEMVVVHRRVPVRLPRRPGLPDGETSSSQRAYLARLFGRCQRIGAPLLTWVEWQRIREGAPLRLIQGVLGLVRKHPRECSARRGHHRLEQAPARYSDFCRPGPRWPTSGQPAAGAHRRRPLHSAHPTNTDWRTCDEPETTHRLYHLRLSGMAEALPGRSTQAQAAPLPHLDFFQLLVDDELAKRSDRLFARRLKQAEIHQIKESHDFDWSQPEAAWPPPSPSFASARFVATHEGVLLIDRLASARATSLSPSPFHPRRLLRSRPLRLSISPRTSLEAEALSARANWSRS